MFIFVPGQQQSLYFPADYILIAYKWWVTGTGKGLFVPRDELLCKSTDLVSLWVIIMIAVVVVVGQCHRPLLFLIETLLLKLM